MKHRFKLIRCSRCFHWNCIQNCLWNSGTPRIMYMLSTKLSAGKQIDFRTFFFIPWKVRRRKYRVHHIHSDKKLNLETSLQTSWKRSGSAVATLIFCESQNIQGLSVCWKKWEIGNLERRRSDPYGTQTPAYSNQQESLLGHGATTWVCVCVCVCVCEYVRLLAGKDLGTLARCSLSTRQCNYKYRDSNKIFVAVNSLYTFR